MDEYLDNPAGRLIPLLSHLRGAGTNVSDRIARGLELTPNSAEVFRALSMALELPAQLRVQLPRLGHLNPETVESVVQEIESVLDTACRNYSANANILVSEAALARLADWSWSLHGLGLEAEVSRDTIQDFEDSVRRLVELLDAQNDLDPRVEEFLRNRLASLAKSLVDLRIRGADALQSVVDETIGMAIRLGSEAQPDPLDEESPKSRFWTLIQRVAAACQVASLGVQVLALPGLPLYPDGFQLPAGRGDSVVREDGRTSGEASTSTTVPHGHVVPTESGGTNPDGDCSRVLDSARIHR